jgi:hypothetical protein
VTYTEFMAQRFVKKFKLNYEYDGSLINELIQEYEVCGTHYDKSKVKVITKN